MAKRFNNRKAKEYRMFLEAYGFFCVNTHGDDDIYERDGYDYTVKIPNRNSEIVPIGTAMQVVKCIENCGIGRKEITTKVEKLNRPPRAARVTSRREAYKGLKEDIH